MKFTVSIVILALASTCLAQSQYEEDGRYRPTDEGRYYPDNSGAYVHDNSGAYDPYVYGSAGSARAAPTAFVPVVAPQPAPSAAIVYKQYAQQAPAYTPGPVYAILRQSQDVGLDGYYYEYETENRIKAEEQGKVYNAGTNAEALRANGYYSYVGPDNVQYTVQYTADENGFQAQGAHLPTPPPVPEAIARSLEYQRAKGELKK